MPTVERQTLAVRIALQLRREIASGTIPTAQMLPTEKVLCARFAASRETVRKSLRRLVAEGFLEQVPGKGMLVKVQTPTADTATVSRQITVLTPYPYQSMNYYYRQILGGLAAGSQQYGVPLSFMARDYTTPLEQLVPAGPAVLWPGLPGDQPVLYKWLQENRRFIILSASYEDPDIPCVDCDNAMGVNLALNHLRERGHQAIGIVARSRVSSLDHAARISAAKVLLREKGLHSGPGTVFFPKNGWESPANDQAFAAWRAANQFTAVMALDLELAGILYNLCRRLALRIPEDLSIVAFDDSELAEAFVPPVTTVAQPLETMGFRAVERLAAPPESLKLASPTELFTTVLRIRASVR